MKNVLKIVPLIAPLLLTPTAPSFAMSGAGCSGDCASCHSLTKPEATTLLKDLGSVKEVKPAPVRGLYEVVVEREGRTGVVYLDYGKKHLIAGQVFDLATRKPAQEAAPKKHQERLNPATLSTADALVMGNPKGKKKLFLFTDPECPYCAKMHEQLKKLCSLEPDLAVYIKMFPLKVHPNAYGKARVILARKSLSLLEKSYKGEPLPPAGDADPSKGLDEGIKFAESVGIDATPTLVLQDGRILPGLKDAQTLRKLIR
jgi:thiol:disulfide interchange protein DsbC